MVMDNLRQEYLFIKWSNINFFLRVNLKKFTTSRLIEWGLGDTSLLIPDFRFG